MTRDPPWLPWLSLYKNKLPILLLNTQQRFIEFVFAKVFTRVDSSCDLDQHNEYFSCNSIFKNSTNIFQGIPHWLLQLHLRTKITTYPINENSTKDKWNVITKKPTLVGSIWTLGQCNNFLYSFWIYNIVLTRYTKLCMKLSHHKKSLLF